jgi:hypothetical protein
LSHGFSFSGGKYNRLDFPGADNTSLNGILTFLSRPAKFVGTWSDFSGVPGIHGFLRSAFFFGIIDVPFSMFSQAHGINGNNQIVGVYVDTARPQGHNHGFLLNGLSFSTIDVPGASETYAYGINFAGKIVGRYIASGTVHGFLATPQ